MITPSSVRLVTTRHSGNDPGSITSAHADSAEGAFLTLAQLMKHSAVGQGLATREGIELAQLHIDVVVQCHRERQHRSGHQRQQKGLGARVEPKNRQVTENAHGKQLHS